MDSLTPPISHRALRPPKELLVAWMLLLIDVGEDHGYALRDRYDRFLDAHAEAVARRRGSVVDEASAPVMRDAPTPTHEVAVEVAQVSSAQRALRPRRELLIGWLLLYLDAGATYGYDLRRAFDAQRLSPDPGAMYRMLRQLEADKWVQSRWMSPAAGPRWRFYRLTGRGRRNLDEIAAIRHAHDAHLAAYEHASDSHHGASDKRLER